MTVTTLKEGTKLTVTPEGKMTTSAAPDFEKAIKENISGIAEPVCEKVLDDVSEFTDGAEQSDDITMLCVRYMGEKQDQ